MRANIYEVHWYADLLERALAKPLNNLMRYLFCINAGRSGSNYLAELLATAQGVAAFHEAEPAMHGAPLHRVNVAPLSSSYAERRVKLDGIARLLAERRAVEVYAETNHMFIKTFFDVVVNGLDDVEVIHLRRDAARVLKSFIELGYFSPLNPVWRDWMSSPNGATAASRALDADDALDQYDRCIAYFYDIHARAARFRRDYPQIQVHEVELEDILKPAGAQILFERLRLKPTFHTAEVVGKVVNDRQHVKERLSNRTDLAQCRRRLDEYATRVAALGVTIPPSLRYAPTARAEIQIDE